MNASLRLRLALLVVCSVALTVALVLYLTWQRVGETMIGMEEKNFATLLLVEEERLNTATLNHLAAKVRSVLLRKAQLRDTSARVQALLRALAPQRPAGSGQAHLVLQPLLSAMDAASIALVDDVDSIRSFRAGWHWQGYCFCPSASACAVPEACPAICASPFSCCSCWAMGPWPCMPSAGNIRRGSGTMPRIPAPS